MANNPNSNVITTVSVQVTDLTSQSQPTVVNRSVPPIICAVTQLSVQEMVLVPPAGVTIFLGQSYGFLYVRNTSGIVMILTVQETGPINFTWSLPPGGILLYAIPSQGNPTQGEPLTQINIAPQSVTALSVPIEVMIGQLN